MDRKSLSGVFMYGPETIAKTVKNEGRDLELWTLTTNVDRYAVFATGKSTSCECSAKLTHQS